MEYGGRERGDKTRQQAKSAVVKEVRLRRKKEHAQVNQRKTKRRSDSTSYGRPPAVYRRRGECDARKKLMDRAATNRRVSRRRSSFLVWSGILQSMTTGFFVSLLSFCEAGELRR